MLSLSQLNLRLVFSECCLHVSVTKFWHKFASLRQVNTPSSWDNLVSKLLYRHVFDKISTEFCGILRVFVNFAGFCGFTWISGLRDRAKYQKPCRNNKEFTGKILLTLFCAESSEKNILGWSTIFHELKSVVKRRLLRIIRRFLKEQ